MYKAFFLALTDILGGDAGKLDSDERLKLKVKGTGITLRQLMEKAAAACEKAAASALDKRGAWLACMDEVLGRAIELLNRGVSLSDDAFSAEIDGAGVTLRDVVAPYLEACRRTTVKTVNDEEENARRCAVDAMLVTKLRLRELFA